MDILTDFTGGNIVVVNQTGCDVELAVDLRDSSADWFYWAFRVVGAAGKTVRFDFGQKPWIGPYGPAISHDLITWQWLGNSDSATEFSYTFAEDENEIYFAHDMLYHPSHFETFVAKNNITPKVLCQTEKGRPVPYLDFGHGDTTILLTARHHACESSGSYVLQGVLEYLLQNPIENCRIIAMPFVDYDGVVDGDQGKDRIPHDHNRDYTDQPIYKTVQKLLEITANLEIQYAFDFHSPWHCGERHDQLFIVETLYNIEAMREFGQALETNATPDAIQYFTQNDIPVGTEWNTGHHTSMSNYFGQLKSNRLSFSFETPYFGTADNMISQEKMINFGHCFGKTIAQELI